MLELIKRSPLSAKFGMTIIALTTFVVIFAPFIAPYGESSIVGGVWEEASSKFILGTDNLGRDMLTRLIYGARMTVLIALSATLISFAIGTTAGFSASIYGGYIDTILSRTVDTMMAVPSIIFALLVLSVLGTDTIVLILVASILDSTRVFRLSRAISMDISVMEYVESARLRGEGIWWVMFKEILPNCMGPLMAEFGLRFCFQFLFISSLSFIGLGIQPPHADWGGIVRDNAAALGFGLFAPLYPAFCIAIVTIGVNLVVDWALSSTSRSVKESRYTKTTGENYGK